MIQIKKNSFIKELIYFKINLNMLQNFYILKNSNKILNPDLYLNN